jgi:hypothetical protein
MKALAALVMLGCLLGVWMVGYGSEYPVDPVEIQLPPIQIAKASTAVDSSQTDSMWDVSATIQKSVLPASDSLQTKTVCENIETE